MFHKIFVTLLMFLILMICLAQNSTEEPADTAMPFIARLHDRPVWRFGYAPDGKTLASESSDGTLYLWRISAQ